MSRLYQKLTELFREIIDIDRLLVEVYQSFNSETELFDLTEEDYAHLLGSIEKIKSIIESIDNAKYTEKIQDLILKAECFLKDRSIESCKALGKSIGGLFEKLPDYMLECMQTQESSDNLKEELKNTHSVISNIAKKILSPSASKITQEELIVHKDLEYEDEEQYQREAEADEDLPISNTPKLITNKNILKLNEKFNALNNNYNHLFRCFYETENHGDVSLRKTFDWNTYYIKFAEFQNKIRDLESSFRFKNKIPKTHILKNFEITKHTKTNEIKGLFRNLNKGLDSLYRHLHYAFDKGVPENKESLNAHQQAPIAVSDLKKQKPSKTENCELPPQSSYGHMMQQQGLAANKSHSPMNKTALSICILSSASFGLSLGYLIEENCWNELVDYLTPDGASPVYGDIFLSVMLLALIAIAAISGYVAYKSTQGPIKPEIDSQPLLQNHSSNIALTA